MNSKIFAHSRLDGLLVLLALVQLAVLLHGALTFGAVPWWHSLAAGVISVYLTTTNFKCVAHNFIHNPFFRSRRLNGAYSVFNSLLIGGPQSIYRLHHLNHHKYNNDPPDPETGTTGDLSSTWRHSHRPGCEEGFLSYTLLGYFRTDFGLLLGEARKKHLIRRVYAELAAVLALVVAIGWLNPLGLVLFYLPVWYLGNAAAQAENYLEHHGARPGDRTTDSVSCYGSLYNLLRFNHGYHQEHHFRPQVHWTRVPGLRSLLPPESERRVVRGAHWFNFAPRGEAHVQDGAGRTRRLFIDGAPEGPSSACPAPLANPVLRRVGALARKPLELVEENFRRPAGWSGRMIGHAMALQHRSLTVWTIEQMNVRPTDRILDVGCGGGMAIKLLSRIAREGFICGMDYSREMVRQATRRNSRAIEDGRVEIALEDAMALPYGDGIFDQVCGIETFYFWPDPLQGLREAYRVLKPGGQLAITVEMSKEASGQTSAIHRYLARRFTERSARQGLLIYSGEELAGLMRQAGFPHARYVTAPNRSLGWLCALARK